MSVVLFECTVYDPVAATQKTIRVATESYNHPSAPGYYADRIVTDSSSMATVVRSVWENEKAYGAGRLDIGDVDVANRDGEYDWLVSNGCVYGYTARLLILESAESDYADAVPIATGVVEGASYSFDRVVFRWRDTVATLLDKTAQKAKFAGSNVLPDGVEGSTDLKDSYKPRFWGRVNNVPIPCVNTSKLIYQVSTDSAGWGIDWMFWVADKGYKLTKGSRVASLSALQAGSPAAGTWDYFSGAAGVFIRLGSSPVGQITCSISYMRFGADWSVTTPKLVWAEMMEAFGIIDLEPSDYEGETDPFATCGVWCGLDEVIRRDALNKIAATIGAVYWVSPTGTWRLKEVNYPGWFTYNFPELYNDETMPLFTAQDWDSAVTAQDGDILDFEWLLPGDGESNPVHQVDLKFSPNHAVTSSDAIAGVVGLAPTSDTFGQLWLTKEWRTTTASDATLPTVAPLSRQVEFETQFAEEDPEDVAAPPESATTRVRAQQEAERRLAMLKRTGPKRAKMTVKFGPGTASAVDLMSLIRVKLPRYGLDDGEPALVTSISMSWRNMTAELGLYF